MAQKPKGSPRFRLNIEDLHSVKRGILIGVSGIVLTFLTSKYLFYIPPEYQVYVSVIMATLANIARKFLANNSTSLKGGSNK